MISSRPIIVSAIWGIVTGIIIGVATPLLLLGELGGPIDFSPAFLLLSGVMLALAAFTTRARSGLTGCLCGLAFSSPIVLACYIIAKSDPTIVQEHGGELRSVGFAVVVLSIAAMTIAAKLWAANDESKGR